MPRITVPDSILVVLDSVLEARRWCAKQFSTANEVARTLEGDSHQNFISVLKRIRTLLADRVGDFRTSKPDTSSTTTRPSITRKGKLFQLLELEDVSTEFEKLLPNLRQGTKIPRPSAKIDFDLEELEQEELLATECFLIDCQQIRFYVPNIWQTFGRGKIELVIASLTTDTAVDLWKKTHSDLVDDFPELEDHSCITGLQDRTDLKAITSSIWVNTTAAPTEGMCPGATDLRADLFYSPVYEALSELRHRSKDGESPALA